jgi:23S rRNA (uracil1939-C5)-methyltransferase
MVRDGRLFAGFYRPHTHECVEIPGNDCRLQPEAYARVIDAVVGYANKFGVSAYDEAAHTGLLRHIYIRSADSGDFLLCLVINGDEIPQAERLIEAVSVIPGCKGVLLSANKRRTNVILGDGFTTIWGEGYIYDVICGLRVKVSAGAFYQVNRRQAERLYGVIREAVAPQGDMDIFDLYCGAGTIGLSLAREVGSVAGIEINAEAVECARENAAANGISNAVFVRGGAELIRGRVSTAKRAVIIADPPRGGCDPATVAALAESGAGRIIYVSCNPATLARDLRKLNELGGYEPVTVTPVDMFPRTAHVEVVAELRQK